jgi:hypothetical protein
MVAAFPAGSLVDRAGQGSPGGAENRIVLLRENALASASFDHATVRTHGLAIVTFRSYKRQQAVSF